MTSVVETPVGVKAGVSAGRPARSSMSRLGRPALIFAACALLAGGGYYAWRLWFAPDSSANPVLTAVFAEDTEILEAQQENILRRPDRELLNFKIDAGGVNARRIIEREVARQGAK